MTVLAAIPSPTQGVWALGPLPIRAYALCIVAGIVAAVLITERRWVARGGAPGDVLDIAVWAVPFGIIGGRIYHVISSPRAYFGEGGDPMRAFAIWEGGLGIWGAIALGGVGAWIACRRRGIPLPAFADALAPGLLVAQAIGRLGNWFNNELYGGPTDLPWALRIYEWDSGRAVARADGEPVAAGHVPPDVPLRDALEPGRGRAGHLGRPAVPARPRPGLRALRRVLLPRPALDRAAAHRPGRDVLRRAAQRLHLGHRRLLAVAYLSSGSAAGRGRSSTGATMPGATATRCPPVPTRRSPVRRPGDDGHRRTAPTDAFRAGRVGQVPT